MECCVAAGGRRCESHRSLKQNSYAGKELRCPTRDHGAQSALMSASTISNVRYGAVPWAATGRDPSITPIRRPTDFELTLSAKSRKAHDTRGRSNRPALAAATPNSRTHWLR
jgi:hypothetical protein